jgi:hypothetical protein
MTPTAWLDQVTKTRDRRLNNPSLIPSGKRAAGGWSSKMVMDHVIDGFFG